jgi:hypothetical protein
MEEDAALVGDEFHSSAVPIVTSGVAACMPASGFTAASFHAPPQPQPMHPDSAQWQASKHLIEDMYVRRNLPLRDVMALMEARHGFKAT